jgi:cytochrome c7-like protein
MRPIAVQPIEFPHNTHVAKKVKCTEYCHESVTKGPIAGLPSVKTCMICHDAIATDKPRIQQIAKLSEEGRDLDWQRVYGYTQQAHVRFNHAPHIRANVDCATCHGNIAQQTVAQRTVDLSMGFCVNCHRQSNAPNDCLTCHY